MEKTLEKIYILLTAFSGVCMGMNSILFCFCIYVLWGQNRRLLMLSSFVQFALSTVQMVLCIIYLIVALSVYPGGAEDYFLHINKYSLPCYIIYIINYAIEEFLLIWRIYVLYGYDIKVCVPSTILLALQIAIAGVTAKGFATKPIITGPLHAFNLTTWALIAAVNMSATFLICLRLYIARRRIHAILSQSKYKSTIIVVIECGALVTVCTIAMLILYAVKNPGALAGVGITTQVATMAPLLIVARYGILGRKTFASEMPLRIAVVRTEVTRVDTPLPNQKSDRASDGFRSKRLGNNGWEMIDGRKK